MARSKKESRNLLSYLMKHRRLTISSVGAGAPRPVGEFAREEKHFLLAFITNTIASILIILSRVWDLTSPTQLLGLGFGDLATIILASAALVTTIMAWLAYFEIGVALTVERAVEIKPKSD